MGSTKRTFECASPRSILLMETLEVGSLVNPVSSCEGWVVTVWLFRPRVVPVSPGMVSSSNIHMRRSPDERLSSLCTLHSHLNRSTVTPFSYQLNAGRGHSTTLFSITTITNAVALKFIRPPAAMLPLVLIHVNTLFC